MKTTLSIWLCKIISGLCHLFKKDGSVYPGSMVFKFDKNILKKIKYPKDMVVVTGSSGKGSTVYMSTHILMDAGKKVIWNKNGSNTNNAVATLLLNNTNSFTHKVNADVVILEMDERYIKDVFNDGTISHILITNVTRDQPARNIYPEIIYNAIMDSFSEKTHLIFNADDPILNRAKYRHKGEITTYGIAKTNVDVVPTYSVDAAYCPRCHTKLDYASYHYGHLGLYKCPNCDFERGKVNYEGKKVDLKNGTFEVDGHELKLNKKVFFALYYTLASYTLTKMLGVSDEDIIKAINDDVITSKRGKAYELEGRKIEMLESKNENSLSYLQSLNYIKDQKGKKTVIMGFENVSRRYIYNDLSWLWDINFELLNDPDIDKIFCIGRFNYDVATRLDYAGIPSNKIVLVDDLSKLLDMVLEQSKGDIYTMVCFDMTAILLQLLKEHENEKNN